jgi:dedicator of cytokinesis protein 3
VSFSIEAVLIRSLLGAYQESNDPRTLALLARHQIGGSLWKQTPDVFPMAYPFALVAQLPPPSLLERQKLAGEDSLPPQSELFKCSMAETAVVILSLILASPVNNFHRWLSEILDIEGVQACSKLLVSMFKFAKSIIAFEAFPKTWLTLSLMAHGSIVKMLGCTAEILEKEDFIPVVRDSGTFDVSLWTEYFEVLCDLIGSEALALEEHTHQKRRAGWVIAGDLRDDAVALLVRLWNAIGWPIDENDKTGQSPRYGGVSLSPSLGFYH